MKTKVGELYNKPIVVGNPNEFNKHEIPLNKLGGGDSFDDGMEYYLVLDRSILSSIILSETCDSSQFFVTVLADGRTKSIETRAYIDSLHFADYCIAFCTSKICKFDNRDTLTCKENLQNVVDLNNQSYFKRITAKEYYSLLD